MAYTFKHGDRPLEEITVQRAVGRGGFGEVYYALADSGKQLALKYLRENPEIELRGIAHVMNLKSPYLITIYDVKRNAAGEPFVLMEYVSGPSLRELMLAEPNGLGAQKSAFFLKGIAKGLSHLHERGIVHRDLKPANIFYDDGYVKIGDYGLSKHMSISKHSGQTVSVGTVHYMAPEIGSGSYTRAIDVYALGVILYEMLTGRLPFSGSSMGEILMRHLRDNPDLSGIPAPFAGVIAKALAKDPKDRYQDADEMLVAVMGSEDVSQSVAAFDASALTQVPRSPEASDLAQTVTSPHRPPPIPPLDVRAADLSQELPERLQRKLEHLNRKLERRGAKLEKKFGPRRGREKRKVVPGERPAGGRWAQSFILLAVVVGIALVLGLLGGATSKDLKWPVNHETRVMVFVLLMIGGTVGPLLTHLRLLPRTMLRNSVLDRLAHASVAGLFMLPAYGIAADEHEQALARVIIAPIAALLLCDWTQRMEAGRLGKVDGWAAFWPGVVGLIAANVFGADGYEWHAAGVCAALSLLAQAAASMWPPGQTDREAQTAILGADHPDLVHPSAMPARAAQRTADADDSAGAERPAEEASPPPLPAAVMETVQPSFAGRATNAGLSFVGKLFLMLGLLVALGHGAAQKEAQNAIKAEQWEPSCEVASMIDAGIPPGVVLVALCLGAFFLVAGRRSDGAAHFLRGCLGGVFTVVSGMLAMTVARYPVTILLTQCNLGELQAENLLGPLLGTGIVLGLGLLLLLWPKAQRGRPIVV